MAAELNELDTALRYFAETYFAGVTGSEWDEACGVAETVANGFRFQRDTFTGEEIRMSDSAVASHLYVEAERYADM